MKYSLAASALAALTACGAAATTSSPAREATPAPAHASSASTGEEVSFGRFVAPIPPGFTSGNARPGPVAFLLGGSTSVVFLKDLSEPVPTDDGGCQGYADGATTGFLSSVAKEQLELEILRSGPIAPHAGVVGGCWIETRGKGATADNMPYVTAALRFARGSAIVICLTSNADDAAACETVADGVRETNPE